MRKAQVDVAVARTSGPTGDKPRGRPISAVTCNQLIAIADILNVTAEGRYWGGSRAHLLRRLTCASVACYPLLVLVA